MKLLVLYDTKHGTTAEVARAIASASGGTAVPLASCPASLAGYDKVVLGAPVYFGQWSKALGALALERQGELSGPRLYAFALGMMPNDYVGVVKAALPAALADKIGGIRCFGGRVDPAKLGFAERFITKMVSKASAKQGQAAVELDLAAATEFGRRLRDEA
ncbi:MAG TPA: flavodoxin domain-containing protein [Rectinemataceae bacterium]|nr:flavodoxin domain-containing protein [Rectinemataceae bacterium]